ncbi:MAG: glucose-6-phosphate dehydrogenase [Gemmatimonadota bacterium]|nr:glucose-6-phosphate dehydrogenase [Gemmatimonadota bacterium]
MSDGQFEVGVTGLQAGHRPDACTLVIFGASGDLTQRELVPAVYELFRQDLLPDAFAVVGFSRSNWSDDAFRERMRVAARTECDFDAASWRQFQERVFYVPGDFTATADYERLKHRVTTIAGAQGCGGNQLFHLAAPPDFFGAIVEGLSASGLARDTRGWRRVVIEKPFGRDLASGRALDARIRGVFREDQIYRIDHFLGKETVQNMLVVRFANPSFEPIWNRNYIDHVQITVGEDIGIGTRAAFYERTGVVRDMVQNHLLQLLCMTAIEPPVRFDGNALRDETVKVLDAVQPLDLARDCVRGQYGPGTTDGAQAAGYRQEANVADDSTTATFAAVKLTVDNWRWAGVPFYLRTGKRLARKLTEVVIHFKPTPHLMFRTPRDRLHANVLAFRLQPDEGIIQTFAAKQPGPGLSIHSVRSSFLYASAFGIDTMPRAYAWLEEDAMRGDQTHFARSDWIERAWTIVDPLTAHWETDRPADFPNYAAGTWGPAAADALLARDGRAWTVI